MTLRGAIARLGLLAGGLLVGAGLAEIAFRAFGAYSPASFHLLPPHARLRDAQTGWDVTYETNSQGWRDEEYTPVKPAGVTRVAVIGDSFTFGQGCERGAIFPDRLEALLNARRKDVEVLNLSTPGLGPEGYFVLLQDALRYEPDAVVVSIGGNDASGQRRTPRLNEVVRALSHRFRLFVLLREVRRRVASPPALDWEGLERRADPRSGLFEFHRRYGPARTNLVAASLSDPAEVARWTDVPAGSEGWRRLEGYVGRMARICRAKRSRLVLAVVPDGAQVDPHQIEIRRLLGVPLSPDAATAEGRLQALVRELARRNAAACLDPLEDFRRVRNGLYFPTDLHWTPAGHRLYAEALAGLLAQGGGPERPE